MTDMRRPSSRELDRNLTTALESLKRLVTYVEADQADKTFLLQRLNSVYQAVEELAAGAKEMEHNEQVAKLYTVSRLIGSSLDLQTVLDQVMDAIIDLTGAERGILMLLENGELAIRAARNFDQETIESGGLTISRTITERVVQDGQPVVTTNAQDDPRFAATKSVINNQLLSIMASPLVRPETSDQVIGVVYVDSRVRKGLFSEDDLRLLAEFGAQAAIAIDNAVQVQQRESTLKAQIRALQIEVDEVKKAKQVQEIVETEYFQKLRDEAQRLRKRTNRTLDD
jgi:GAF domain-containing protein